MFIGIAGCLNRESRAAVRVFQHERDEIAMTTTRLLRSVAEGDTTSMAGLSTDSLSRVLLGQRTLKGSTAFQVAAQTLKPKALELARCKGRLWFTYDIDGETRDGISQVRCRGEGWELTGLSLDVQIER